MTEPLDPMERRLSEALHGRRPDVTPDVVGARAVFLERRRRRERKRKLLALAASGSTALTITLVAMLLNFGGGGTPKDSLGIAAGDQTTHEADLGSASPVPMPNVSLPAGTVAGPMRTVEASPGPDGSPADRCEGCFYPVPSPHPSGSAGYASASPGAVVSSSPQPEPSSPPTAASSCSKAKEVRAGDSADCYVLRLGETLTVSYDESYWSNPESSDEQVLRTGETTHVQCVRAPCYGQMTDFTGNGVGKATVSAYGDPCKNNPPDQPMCGAPVQLWEITVHVVR